MRKSRAPYVCFIAPALIFYIVFMFWPLISSLGLSFFQWTGYGEKTFVGFENFIKLFTHAEFSKRFWNALSNNALFFVFTIVFQNLVAVLIAVLLTLKIKGARFFRTMFFLPTTLSIVIVGFIWTLIYNPLWGPLNVTLKGIGLKSLAIPWLGDESTALICVAITNAWQYMAIPMLLFTAGIQAIPEETYEAASIDGANGWKQFAHITLPLIAPVMFIITTLVFVSNFSAFEIIYAMQGTLGAPNYATDILGTFFYRTSFGQRAGAPPDMGMGAAIATIMFIVILIGVAVWFKIYGNRRAES